MAKIYLFMLLKKYIMFSDYFNTKAAVKPCI